MLGLPDGYKQYLAVYSKQGKKLNKKLVRFATRYAFAGQLESITVHSASEHGNEVYGVALRIALGYSALEALEGRKGTKSAILESTVAEQLKLPAFKGFMDFLEEESDPKVAKELRAFRDSKRSADIRHAITAVRHSMFHAQFNPTAAGLGTKAGLKLLKEMDKALFRHINARAKTVFAEQIKNVASAPDLPPKAEAPSPA
jgi:hypothetical protein